MTITDKTQSPETVSTRNTSMDVLFCVLGFGLCMLAIWPVANMGINDDWSYILTTQAYVQTHHFVYNGWATAMLGWQVLWGSVFAWLFGAGFTPIRLSMIPIAAASAALYYAILRDFSLNRAHALFGTLTFALSPLFLALSATFMSDIPGLFAVLLCIYLCQRALSAPNDTHAALWLVAAGLTNIIGGTVRQISWLGVLVIVPCCAWLLRRRRHVIPVAVVTWIVAVIAIKLLIDWFLRHSYSIPEKLLPGTPTPAALLHLVEIFSKLVTVTLVLTLPVLIAGAVAAWPLRKAQVLRAVALVGLLGVVYLLSKRAGRPDLIDSLWLGNIITPYGIMQGPDMFASAHRIPIRWMTVVFALLFLCALSFIEAFVRRPPAARPRAEGPDSSWQAMNVLLLPFLLTYILLLCPRAAFTVLFDRYLLEIVAVLLIFLLRWHQERISAQIPVIAIGSLVAIAILGVAGTHDLFSRVRAEVRLTDRLLQAGIPRTSIRGGFDFDTVTEVYTAGYLNDPHLVNPRGSFHPLRTDESGPCGDPFLVYLPAMHVRYVITQALNPCLRPTDFPVESYRTILPPAKRELFVAAKLPLAGPMR